jgi:hypothetical protein
VDADVIDRAFLGRAGAAVVVLLAAISVVAATPAPASAHTISGPRPTNFLTNLGAVTPRVPGVTVHVVDLGNKLELTNRTSTDVVVLGYFGEPYLRIGPRGVFENLRSPATYLDKTRLGTTPVPAIALHTGPTTPPEWRRVSGGHTAIWHDHRIHWMGTSPPLAVRRDPGAFHTVNPRWTVALVYGARPVAITGSLDWVPGPSGWPWLAPALALFALGCVVALRRRAALAIAAVVVVVGVDLAHTITAEVARPGSQLAKTVQFFGDNFVSVIVWVAAAITIWGLRRARVEARYGLLLVGAMVALVSGVSDLSYLWKSQLPTIGPHVLARAEVVTELGLGFGLAVGALMLLWRATPRGTTHTDHDPRWVERMVGDLDDTAVDALCGRLVADEVIPLALADVAARAVPAIEAFGDGGLAFVVLAADQIGSHAWSLTAGVRDLRVQRGTPAPVRAEVRTTFPALLQLLAGARTLEESIAAGRLDVNGDPALIAAIEPFLHPDAPDAPDTVAVRPVASV